MRSILTLLLLTVSMFASSNLFEKIEGLNVGIGEYKLGKKLTVAQKSSAKRDLLETNSDKIYKFRDNDIYISVDKASDRAVVIYRVFEDQNSTDLKRILGGAIGAYAEPTTMSHGNIVYWVYRKDGSLITNDDYEQWRNRQLNSDNNSTSHGLNYATLNKLYTVKLSSSKMFESDEKFDDAKAYLIVSSQALLEEIVK